MELVVGLSDDQAEKELAKPVPSAKSTNTAITPEERAALEQRLEHLLEKLPASSQDIDLPRQALQFAITKHGSQRRVSGEPYISHPLAVAELVAGLVPEPATITAAILHDVIEDTDCETCDLEGMFGAEVAFLVDGVTNVSRIPFGMRHEKQIENLRRLLMATAKDLRVIVIKLCDRLHNMRTLSSLSRTKQRRICQTTLDVFAPLAHRLGLKRIKNELEDLCLYYLHPGMYRFLKMKVDERLAERQDYGRRVQTMISDVLATNGIEAKVEWRVKHFWSIYQKMVRDNREFSEIYDLTGIRILVNSIGECYAALGIIHGVWPQVEGRFKDYISSPKSNDYRSIHTTVLGSEGRLLEVQIRTEQMHRVCEEGVAAHWRYKEKGRSSRKLGDDAAWISQISGILQDIRDAEEWTSTIKTDLFADECYCYTPKGDIVRLPAGSCPIDFAYSIHTQLGERCQGARVNGRFRPLSYQLQTGDVVQIETSKSAHPTSTWLNMVRTARARSKIRTYLLHANRDELVEQGRLILSREINRLGINAQTFYNSPLGREIMESLEIRELDDLFALVGFGRIATKQVIARILQSRAREKKVERSQPSQSIQINEIDDMLYRLAKCCHPMVGEPIIGLVTRGRGISIHRENCTNIIKFQGDRSRLIPLSWEESRQELTTVRLSVAANDRKQLLADVAHSIASAGANVTSCQTISPRQNARQNNATLDFEIEVRDIKHLGRIAESLVEIPGVIGVYQQRGKRKTRLA